MGLFQKPPVTPEEIERSRPLEISPDEVLEFDEKEWYARAYRGDDVPQLTVRAVLMGSFLGFLLAFTNLYVGLKSGWSLGVAITACILSFSLWSFFTRLGIVRSSMTILENNCMQSTASAAGYSTGGTMVSAISALLILSATPENPQGHHIAWPVLAAWTFALSALGVMLAIPMKRNMINQEKLKFPTGTAAAVTLQSLYSEGKEALHKARALFISGAFSLMIPLLISLRAFTDKVGGGKTTLLPDSSALFDWLPGASARGTSYKPSDWTIVMDHSVVMIGAGALVGIRMAFWMLAGGLMLAYWVGPMAMEAPWVNPLGQTVYAASTPGHAWKEIGIWVGAPIMVASGLLAFLMNWKTIVRALTGFSGKGAGSASQEDHLRVEVPTSWFVAGTFLCSAAVILIAWQFFHVPILFGVLAILFTFVLALVACRATGESDITPTGAMGKIMQLTYGVLIPQNSTANLMTAGITAGAAGASADLLTDLKSGYLLGANPRRQWVAQFMGIFSGTIATVVGFYMLVPDATVLTGTGEQTPQFPAPAAQQWKAVAEVFQKGFENFHPMQQHAILWGLLAGTVMVLAERWRPRMRKWLPAATGVGLGFILPFQYPLSMFIGALGAWAVTRSSRKAGDLYVIPVASGIIAGESIMGVVVAALNNFVL